MVNGCVFCASACKEDSSHMFLFFSFARAMWNHFFYLFVFHGFMPSLLKTILDSCRFGFPTCGGAISWNCIFAIAHWSIWFEKMENIS